MKSFKQFVDNTRATVLLIGLAACALTPSLQADPKDERELVGPTNQLVNFSSAYNQEVAKQLAKTTAKGGVAIEPENTVIGMERGTVFAVAPVKGNEKLSSAQLEDLMANEGLTAAAAFISSTDKASPLGKGFYKFRFHASPAAVDECLNQSSVDPTGSGRCEVMPSAGALDPYIEVVDMSGKVVLTQPAALQKFVVGDSPVGPLDTSKTFVDASLEHNATIDISGTPSLQIIIRIWVQIDRWRGCWIIPIGRRLE
jgi:hypothetical protein